MASAVFVGTWVAWYLLSGVDPHLDAKHGPVHILQGPGPARTPCYMQDTYRPFPNAAEEVSREYHVESLGGTGSQMRMINT